MSVDPPIHIEGSVGGDVVGGNQTITQTAGGDIVGGDKLTHTGTGHIFAGTGDVLIVQPQLSPATTRDRADLRLLLNKVTTFWIEGVLERSVHNAFLLELGLELRADAVDHPWASVLELPDATRRPLPPNTPVNDIFEQSSRALLILGEPGSGKTITLLELARALIRRAEADNEGAQPIPVVFNLSNWHAQRLPLGAWMASELASKYQVPTRIGRAWLEQQRLLPLLDGLDEVAPERQADCVAAINTYTVQHGLPGLAVCSRLEDYTRLPIRLRLNAAIRLSPPTPAQINAYLEAGGPRLDSLRQVMQGDDVLTILAQSPLFLSIMRLAYQDLPPEALAGPGLNTIEARRQHLLELYVARMVKRKGTGPGRFSETALVRWLAWLARQMSAHSQSVYLVERMQPSWLTSRIALWLYALATRVSMWWLLGLGLSIFFVLVFITIYFADPEFAALMHREYPGTTPDDFVDIIFDISGRFAFLGLLAGLLTALRFEISRFMRSSAGCLTPALNLLLGSVLPALGVIPIMWRASEILHLLPVRLLMTALLSFPVAVLSAIAFHTWDSGDSPQTDIPPTDALHWSWVQSILGVAGGFIGGALIGSACMLALVFAREDTRFLFVNLVTGALPGAIVLAAGAGLTAGLRAKAIEGTPRAGSWLLRHARNVLLAAVLAALTLGVSGGLGMLTYTLLVVGDTFAWEANVLSLVFQLTVGFGLSCAILAGTVAAFYYGGVTLIKHIFLRLLLVVQRRIPGRLSPIANQAEAAIFLRRVGGGYIFIHRLVQDYFASLPTR